MQIRYRLLASAVLLLVLNGCASVPKGNPLALSNPDFEEAPSAVSPIPGWELEQHAGRPGERAYTMVLDSTNFRSGAQSLRVTRLLDQVYGLVHQKIRVSGETTGKRLAFSAWLKTEAVGTEGWMLVVNMNAGGSILRQSRSAPVIGSTDWHLENLVIDVPAGTTEIDLGFILLDSGTGWADQATARIESSN